MKIALVVPYLLLGGMEMCVLRLGRHFRSRGHEVTILATERAGEWWPRVAEQGLNGVLLPLMDSFSRLTHVRRVHEALRGYDAVITNYARYAQAALPGLDSSKIAITVIHNHDVACYDVACGNVQALDAVVAVSPKVREGAVARVGEEIVTQIFYGIEIPEPNQPSSRRPIGEGVRLIYAGRIFQQQKGIFLLPEILAELKQAGLRASLEIVGDGSDLAELKQRSARAQVEELVHYSGALSSEEVGRRLEQSHILLLPSFYEGFPIIPLEAQAHGCVPVASYLPGITEPNVLGGVTGLFGEVGNAKSFADCVHSLANDPARWQTLSDAGRERMRREFSVEVMGDAYLALIERIRAQKPAGEHGPRPGRRWDPKLIGYTAPLPNWLCQRFGIV